MRGKQRTANHVPIDALKRLRKAAADLRGYDLFNPYRWTVVNDNLLKEVFLAMKYTEACGPRLRTALQKLKDYVAAEWGEKMERFNTEQPFDK